MPKFSTDQSRDALRVQHSHRAPDDEAQKRLRDIRQRCLDLAVFIDDQLPPSRERSCALTKLDEARMFAPQSGGGAKIDLDTGKMLHACNTLANGGSEIGRTQLAELSGYEANGGSFRRYLSDLSSLGFLRYPKRTTVAAASILFPEGLR